MAASTPASAQTQGIPPPSLWRTGNQRMTLRQEGLLDRLAEEQGVYLPFLDPCSSRYLKLPSKANASRLIGMLQNGQIPSRQFINSLQEVPHKNILALLDRYTANDPPTEAMIQQLRRLAASRGIPDPYNSQLTKADVAVLLRVLENM